MSRFKRVIHSAASGYGVLATTALFSLASYPLALHFLIIKEFGLWAVMATIGGYLALVDFGMSSSLARLLVDHKDERANGIYGSLIQTGALVFATQGILIFIIGFFCAPLFCHWMDIEPRLQESFIGLVRWQSGLLAFGFAIRVFGQMLYAHQRIDLSNYSQIFTTALNFFALWFFFKKQQGVFSLIWANLISSAIQATILLFICWRLRLFPSAGEWGRISLKRFRELFDYGKDMFLVALGTQLIIASQSVVITRTLGLEMAGIWSVGIKMFNLFSQAIWRISDVSGPAFAEMIVRKEQGTVRERYKSMVVLTASFSGVAAVSYALCNSLFINVWMSGKVAWSPLNDALLAIWMIVLALLHCHSGLVLLTKEIRFMRYVYFIEGMVFVVLAFLTSRSGGLPAIILSSIFCSIAFSGAYGVWRMSDYFGCSLKEVGWNWLKPMGKVLAFYIPAALFIWWAGASLSTVPRLALNVLFSACFGLYLFLRHGLTGAIQTELLHRAPRKMNSLLRRVLSGTLQ